jgi:hypothetical protein
MAWAREKQKKKTKLEWSREWAWRSMKVQIVMRFPAKTKCDRASRWKKKCSGGGGFYFASFLANAPIKIHRPSRSTV